MPCRIGITTDLATRKKYWEGQVVGLTNWMVLGTYQTKNAAQAEETRLATLYGCQAHAGGPDVAAPWSVYKFDYTRTK